MILVTGGTGLVGSHLLFRLAEKGGALRAIYRDPNKLEKVRRVFSYYSSNWQQLFDSIQWVEADITDIPSLEKAFDRITQVYHCAALISFDPNDLRKLLKANEYGTANIVNMCISKRIDKLCYASSIAAIGKSIKNSKVNENNEWRSDSAVPYALSKHLAEMEVWRGTQEGIPAVIINPGVILGPGFWTSGSGKLFQAAAKGSKYYPPGGTGFVPVDDVVQLMMMAMESDVENERFISVSDNLSYLEVLSKIATAIGRPGPKIELKFWQLRGLRMLDWFWNAISGKGRKLSRIQIDGLRRRAYYDNSKAKNHFEFSYQSLDQCIEFSSQKFVEENPVHFSQ